MRLGVNVDHIATLRQARRGSAPDPVEAALVCERAGAQGIVCHLREDRRHIHDEDVWRLRRTVTSRLNLEMSIAREIVRMALAVRPDQVTLVPERRQELTTEGGLDVVRMVKTLRPLARTFHGCGIEVSLFVDPTLRQLEASRDVGAKIVELHTGAYANARHASSRARHLDILRRAASHGREMGLAVAAGHGLDYANVRGIARIQSIEEVNIGFAIITRAVSVGLEGAVREMVQLLTPSRAYAPQAA